MNDPDSMPLWLAILDVTGVAVLWVSPLGPLKLSYAVPIRAKPDDRRQAIQFTFGGTF